MNKDNFFKKDAKYEIILKNDTKLNENMSIYGIKLTDSCLNAIMEIVDYQKTVVKIKKLLIILFRTK